MTIYSDIELEDAIKSGDIIVHPLRNDAIRGSSIDVSLGEWFYRTDQLINQAGYNPFDKEDVKRYFQLNRAITHLEWSKENKGIKWSGIPDNHPIIVLAPGERILGHTHEFIGIRSSWTADVKYEGCFQGTTWMKGRSTWGRNGIAVCLDAGHGDPNYFNRWTCEIYNFNKEQVPLPVGERIAQIIFAHTGPVQVPYQSNGKYQSEDSLKEIIANWKPEDMLPKAWKDERRLPLSTDL